MTTLARISGHNDLRFLQERYYGATPEQMRRLRDGVLARLPVMDGACSN
jgi:hypothetical protein